MSYGPCGAQRAPQAAAPRRRASHLQETANTGDDTVGREDVVEEHTGELDAVATHIGNLEGYLLAHPRAEVFGSQAIGIRRGNHAHGAAHGDALADRRRQPGDQRRVPVIGLPRHDDALAAGEELCAADGQVVRLGPRAHEHDTVDFVRHRRQEVLRVVQDVLVHIARVRVEQLQLLGNRLGDRRVAVPHRRNVVVHVEVFLTVGIEQARSPPAHQMKRLLLKQTVTRSQHATPFDQIVQLSPERVQVVHIEAVRLENAAIFRSAHFFAFPSSPHAYAHFKPSVRLAW